MNVFLFISSMIVLLTGCDSDGNNTQEITQTVNNINEASIVSVTTSGESQNYTFSVGISSPDTGCEQYANWWEVITEEGTLIYRRILGHSHVNEQPFIRSGGIVVISENQVVIIRAHMNNSGYGTTVFKGSVAEGFTEQTLDSNFATDLETQQPLPDNCAF